METEWCAIPWRKDANRKQQWCKLKPTSFFFFSYENFLLFGCIVSWSTSVWSVLIIENFWDVTLCIEGTRALESSRWEGTSFRSRFHQKNRCSFGILRWVKLSEIGQIEGHLCSQWREAGLTAVDRSGLWRWLHLCQWAKRKDRFFCFSGVDYCFNFRNWLICLAAFRCLARSETDGYVLVSFNKDMFKCYKSANVSFLSVSAAYTAHRRQLSYLTLSMLRRTRTFAVIKNVLGLKVKYSKYSDKAAVTESILLIFLFSFRFAFLGTKSWVIRGPPKVWTYNWLGILRSMAQTDFNIKYFKYFW